MHFPVNHPVLLFCCWNNFDINLYLLTVHIQVHLVFFHRRWIESKQRTGNVLYKDVVRDYAAGGIGAPASNGGLPGWLTWCVSHASRN